MAAFMVAAVVVAGHEGLDLCINAERLIGTVRRYCLDHVVIFGARHLRRVLPAYFAYYNETRTHLSLDKDAPLGRAIEPCGAIVTVPILSGLHRSYARI